MSTYENKVDTKGRVSLPYAFRQVLTALSDSNPDPKYNPFYVFPSPTANVLEGGGKYLIDFFASSVKKARMYSEKEHRLNYIMANAFEVSYDQTGRFVLPKKLVEYAKISDKAVFVGNTDRFQIWNPDMYTQSLEQHEQEFTNSGFTLKKTSQGVGE